MFPASLIDISPDVIEVTPLGWFFVRVLAMVFDRYLFMQAERAGFSRII